MKTIIVIALVSVLGALIAAGALMLRRRDRTEADAAPDKRMARALAIRVGLSAALFLFIMLGWKMGWISPRGLPIAR